jgi:alkanesulfonate monooxygenase SsuD/methylene tetrahydromethanopterin reductase-like flavin-dependent oxidoreductase (luciferase family)
MKIDTTLLVNDLSEMPAMARAAEKIGFDGIWTSETAHDAFLPLVLAAKQPGATDETD